ncbi:MAG: MOSC domain-containing protein [Cyclobacteriaceae bacterium]|nr:MOSC domain-containing protein [Cyclobacteriaceae bacterium]
MKLTDIIIYPVKSLRGISLTRGFAGIRGLMHDRRYLLVDDAGHFITQRKHPSMATFDVLPEENGFSVSQGGQMIHIPYEISPVGKMDIDIWDDQLTALIAPENFSEWFSDHLGYSCHLVYMNDTIKRPVAEKYRVKNANVSFADALPYLLTGESSLHDLNSRLEVPVPMNRFRPNLVFSGGEAFSEDSFIRITIGDAIFRAVKPCARCIVTTTDQQTGDRGKEPLSTLATYRKNENKVLFGQNLICLQEGNVYLGDKLVTTS